MQRYITISEIEEIYWQQMEKGYIKNQGYSVALEN